MIQCRFSQALIANWLHFNFFNYIEELYYLEKKETNEITENIRFNNVNQKLIFAFPVSINNFSS